MGETDHAIDIYMKMRKSDTYSVDQVTLMYEVRSPMSKLIRLSLMDV